MPDNITIGIVDDHELVRRGLAMLINMLPGCNVQLEAAGGQEMIAKLATQPAPAIILMDIVMPGMDGYAATAWLTQHKAATRVLALSTMDAENAIIRMIKSGARGYILKDASPDELKRAFNDVMALGYFYNELLSRRIITAVSKILTEEENPAATFMKLTERELEFLRHACTELSYKEIADRMGVSVRTAEGYRDNLCEKLNLKTRVGLAMFAVKNQLVQL